MQSDASRPGAARSDAEMPNRATNGPSLEPNRPIAELVVPVASGASQDRAVLLAAMLAEAWAASIQLVHVSASISSIDAELEAIVYEIRSRFPRLELTSKHLYGDDPAQAIADHLRPRSLAVVSTDHLDAWKVKGSIAEALLGSAGIPLLLIGPHVTKSGLRDRKLDGEIVVAVDGSAESETGVGGAVALAEALGRRLWLIRVVPEPTSDDERLHPEVGRHLQRLADRCGGRIGCSWEVIQDNEPIGAIETFAHRRDAGFLVVSSRGRTNANRHSMASISGGLIAKSERPVLCIRSQVSAAVEAIG